jgi:hypothetical protein
VLAAGERGLCKAALSISRALFLVRRADRIANYA